MTARVRVETRCRGDATAPRGQSAETVILRGQEVVAVLIQGDPLRHALRLSVAELRSMRESLAAVLERQPRVKRILEALIEYKDQQTRGGEGRSGNPSKKSAQQTTEQPGRHGGAGSVTIQAPLTESKNKAFLG